jgi:hypothetical protein
MSIDVWEIVPSVVLVAELYSTNVQYNIVDSYPFHINHMHSKTQFSTLPRSWVQFALQLSAGVKMLVKVLLFQHVR